MVTHTGGYRRKTRHKLSKPLRERGKLSIRKYIQQFNVGDSVVLKAEPSVQKGMYMPRYHGWIGVVKAKRGACYEVNIHVGIRTKPKTMIVHPVHLKKA